MKKALRSILFLAIIAALAGTAVTFIHGLTEPVIEENAAIEEKAYLNMMFPDGHFTEIEGYTKNDHILDVYEVKDEGYIVKASTYGYNTSAPIIVLIGFDLEGSTVNMAVLQEQETSGYGSRCFEEDFIREAYLYKTSVNEIDTLSGATRTSNAMIRIMEAAFNVIQEVR